MCSCLYVYPKSLHSFLYSHSANSEVGDASSLRTQSSLNFIYTTVSYALFSSPFHPPTAGVKGIFKNCQEGILTFKIFFKLLINETETHIILLLALSNSHPILLSL